MTKALALLFLLAMSVQIIRPLGLPGLKRRGDAWKIAAAALAMFSLTVVLSHIAA
ncbi:MAG: hypothetical protein KF723_17920 [Rhizobiaceae bacterium]|nr:hypothetical protein [Rhizobiaceae bacterium]